MIARKKIAQAIDAFDSASQSFGQIRRCEKYESVTLLVLSQEGFVGETEQVGGRCLISDLVHALVFGDPVNLAGMSRGMHKHLALAMIEPRRQWRIGSQQARGLALFLRSCGQDNPAGRRLRGKSHRADD